MVSKHGNYKQIFQKYLLVIRAMEGEEGEGEGLTGCLLLMFMYCVFCIMEIKKGQECSVSF